VFLNRVLSYRFKVKVEISDGGSTCVFVIFDSDMSYIMEKSCAHFVGKSKVCFLSMSLAIVKVSSVWVAESFPSVGIQRRFMPC
jgi:hypothetical protein